MTRTINDVFEYENVKLKTVAEGKIPCRGCYFDAFCRCIARNKSITGECTPIMTSDNKSRIFKKVEP